MYILTLYVFISYYKLKCLTFAKASRERQRNFPAVNVNFPCDRNIINNITRAF